MLLLRLTVLLSGLCCGVVAAQCSYPPTPRQGFALREQLDQLVTFGDGARTKLDACYPTTTTVCGWPVVLLMHGMGSSRTAVRHWCRQIAACGYCVVTYDVRGHGDAKALNGAAHGFEFLGAAERLDIVEVVDYVKRSLGSAVDTTRLGMYGFSQGGMYCWAAAAWSGRTLPANSRQLTNFPVFRAICPRWWAPVSSSILVPQGKAFHGRLFTTVYTMSQRFTAQTEWFKAIDEKIRKEDFAGVAQMFDADPFRQELALLPSTRVPVFPQVSWNDDWVAPRFTLEALAALPTGVPQRVFLTYPGHEGPFVVKQMQNEIAWQHAMRWFDRYLKELRNDVENEAPVMTGPIHGSNTEYRGLEPVWNRYRDRWPPAQAQPRVFFLRSGGVLSDGAPTTSEPTDVVHHVVPTGYDMAAFIKDEGYVVAVLRSLTPHSIPFDTAALSTDFEIAGTPRVSLEVTPTGRNYQVHCALYRVEGSGASEVEVYLCSGVGLMREPTVHPARLDVTMNHIDAMVRAGQRLRLKVESLSYRRAVEQDNLFVAPYFESVDIAVHHDATRVSSLQVPVVPRIDPALITSHLELDIGGTWVSDVLYLVRAPTHAPSTPYVLAFGMAGMAPGFSFAGRHVHMNWDPLLSSQLLGMLNSPVLPFTSGLLGDQQQRTPKLSLQAALPVSQAAVGQRMIAVGALADGSTTNPVELYFR